MAEYVIPKVLPITIERVPFVNVYGDKTLNQRPAVGQILPRAKA